MIARERTSLEQDIHEYFEVLHANNTTDPNEAHFIATRAAELSEISPFVLYGEGSEGEKIIEDAFVPAILQKLVEAARANEKDLRILIEEARHIVHPSHSRTTPHAFLTGMQGKNSAQDYLLGVVDALEFVVTRQLERLQSCEGDIS